MSGKLIENKIIQLKKPLVPDGYSLSVRYDNEQVSKTITN